MTQKEFIKKLKYLKENEKIELGDYVFFIQDNMYKVWNTYKNKLDNEYRKKDYLLVANDYRYTIQINQNKLLKKNESILYGEKIDEKEI